MIWFALLMGATTGFYGGRVWEWRRVLAYIDRHEDKKPWWIAAGIAADCHHEKSELNRGDDMSGSDLIAAERQRQIDVEPEEKFTTQTILYDEALNGRGVYGNCLQAAFASLLGWDLEAVPNFLTFGSAWWDAIPLWAHAHGFDVEYAEADSIPEYRCIVSGDSPRGVRHSVVAVGGKVVFDPHPSRAGILNVKSIYRVTVPTPRPFPWLDRDAVSTTPDDPEDRMTAETLRVEVAAALAPWLPLTDRDAAIAEAVLALVKPVPVVPNSGSRISERAKREEDTRVLCADGKDHWDEPNVYERRISERLVTELDASCGHVPAVGPLCGPHRVADASPVQGSSRPSSADRDAAADCRGCGASENFCLGQNGRGRACCEPCGLAVDKRGLHGSSVPIEGPEEGRLVEGTPEWVVWRRLCYLDCAVPVDPYDYEDSAAVAVEAVEALREASLLTAPSSADRDAAAERVRRFLERWDEYKVSLDHDAHDKDDDAVTELGMEPPYTELLASDLRLLLGGES